MRVISDGAPKALTSRALKVHRTPSATCAGQRTAVDPLPGRHLVPQTSYLFTGTVASNLRYGRPDADDDPANCAS